MNTVTDCVIMQKEDWQNIVNKIREKTGEEEKLNSGQVLEKLDFLKSLKKVEPKANGVNFYDYDGTLLYSYSLEEITNLKELPPLPKRKGLTCQGWNWTLNDIKKYNREADVGVNYITEDENTHIYISLEEGRTSPVLGIAVNGKILIDWGDGSNTNELNGTSLETLLSKKHEYINAGEYVITITPVDDGQIAVLGEHMSSKLLDCNSSLVSDVVDPGHAYLNSIKKIEFGKNVTLSDSALAGCGGLKKVTLPQGIQLGSCVFTDCSSLEAAVLPEGLEAIGTRSFQRCSSLFKVVFPTTLSEITQYAFDSCTVLSKITIPNKVQTIGQKAFSNCQSLVKIIVSKSAINLGKQVFFNCYSAAIFDFSQHDSVPNLGDVRSGQFDYTPNDLKFYVPSDLIDEWKAANVWLNFEGKIYEK